MASWPGFDPNKPHTVQGTAIRNDLVSLVFEPGSTFKLITASAALEEHTISLQTMVDSENGRMVLSNGEVISDTKDHGVMNVNDAMAYSSNVAFAKIAKTVGDEKFYRYVRAFGIGSPTMIHVPGEESGMLKPVANWSARTILTMAFGHEVLTTPLQIAVAYAVVANGGELIQPRVIKEFRDSETGEVVQSFERKVIRRVISQETAAKVRNMLRDVVQKGTATNIKSEKLDFAGKTGTSEKYDVTTGRYNRGSMTSSFIGMVPASQPRYLCMVVVDEPRKAHVGGLTAGPIFKEIMERIYYHPIVSPAQYQLVHAHAGNKCQSANFIGLSQKSSKQLAADIKCAVAFQGQGGQVVAQRMAQDSTADLVLQLGSMGNKKMPDLRGLSLRDALDALGSARSLVRVEGKGWVVTQDPLPHTSLVQGQPLRLFLREKT